MQFCMGGSHEISLPRGGLNYTVVTSHGPKLPAGIKKKMFNTSVIVILYSSMLLIINVCVHTAACRGIRLFR